MRALLFSLVIIWTMSAEAQTCQPFEEGRNAVECLVNCREAGCEQFYSGGHSWCSNWCDLRIGRFISCPLPSPTDSVTMRISAIDSRGTALSRTSPVIATDFICDFQYVEWNCYVSDNRRQNSAGGTALVGDDLEESLCAAVSDGFANLQRQTKK